MSTTFSPHSLITSLQPAVATGHEQCVTRPILYYITNICPAYRIFISAYRVFSLHPTDLYTTQERLQWEIFAPREHLLSLEQCKEARDVING
jgi:hypothetical protein